MENYFIYNNRHIGWSKNRASACFCLYLLNALSNLIFLAQISSALYQILCCKYYIIKMYYDRGRAARHMEQDA